MFYVYKIKYIHRPYCKLLREKMCQFLLAFPYLEMLQKVLKQNCFQITAVMNCCIISIVGSDVKLVSLGDEVAGT